MTIRRVCVFAGSSDGGRPAYRDTAGALGRELADRGLGVVYGGARVGLMGALADAALASNGEVIGVIPRALMAKEIAHDGLTELRVVSSMHERKATMADLADAFVALPGGWGTLEELFEVLTWGQLGLHRKPCGVLDVEGYFSGLVSFATHMVNEGFVRRELAARMIVANDPRDLIDKLSRSVVPPSERWIGPAET
jgi:uncharacterized protein (TIGR00730 family)